MRRPYCLSSTRSVKQAFHALLLSSFFFVFFSIASIVPSQELLANDCDVSSAQPESSPGFFSPVRQSAENIRNLYTDIRQYLGIRYRFGGQTPAGFDCSGFVRFMFGKVFDMQLPRSSREMSALGSKVARSELKPGDLVFFQTRGKRINHVGIFVGNDTFVHSSLSKGITRDNLSQRYYDLRFAGAVRVLNLPEQTSFPDPEPSVNQTEDLSSP